MIYICRNYVAITVTYSLFLLTFRNYVAKSKDVQHLADVGHLQEIHQMTASHRMNMYCNFEQHSPTLGFTDNRKSITINRKPSSCVSLIADFGSAQSPDSSNLLLLYRLPKTANRKPSSCVSLVTHNEKLITKIKTPSALIETQTLLKVM